MTQNINERVVFAISPEGQGDGVPVVILGIPRGAWRYIRDGKTMTFDLNQGEHPVPVKIMMFGAETHAQIMELLDTAQKAIGNAYIDARNRDFSMKEKKP